MPKQLAFIIIFLLSGLPCFAQNNDYVGRVHDWIKVWGILKYYAPGIANGNTDADAFFMDGYRRIDSPRSQDAFSAMVKVSIDAFVRTGDSVSHFDSLGLQYVDPADASRLHALLLSNHRTKNFYTTAGCREEEPCFKNEVLYSSEQMNLKIYQTLIIARLWNVFAHLSSDRMIYSASWDTALIQALRQEQYVKTRTDFEKLLLEMIAKSHDPHASVYGGSMGYLGDKFYPPFHVVYFDAGFYMDNINGSAGKENPPKKITTVNGSPVSALVDQYRPFISGAVEDYVAVHVFNDYILAGDSASTLSIGYDDGNGKKDSTILKRSISFTAYHRADDIARHNLSRTTIDTPGSLYLDLSDTLDIKKVKHQIEAACSVILDLRAYPYWENLKIVECFLTRPKTNSFFRSVDYKKLSAYTHTDIVLTDAKGFYKGKTIVLISDNTVSRGEYFALLLKFLGADATLLGSPTVGATGGFTRIPLYKGLSASYTSYETLMDGKSFFKKGIVPDVIVYPQLADYQNGVDGVLKKAINLAKQ